MATTQKATPKKRTTKPKAPSLRDELARPFDAVDLRVRPIAAYKQRALIAFYVDARAIQRRLDDTVGLAGWQTHYERHPDGAVVCTLSIKIDGEWIAKQDAADASDIEATKGGISNAFRRAAVVWGIGRYLYDADDVWARLDNRKRIANPQAYIDAYANGTLREFAQRSETQTNDGPPGVKKSSDEAERTKLRKLLAHRLKENQLSEDWVGTLILVANPKIDDTREASVAALIKAGTMYTTVRSLVDEHYGVQGAHARKHIDKFYRTCVDENLTSAHDDVDALFDAVFDVSAPA